MEKSIHNTDEIIRATGADGYLKMAVITAKHTVQRAREIHNTSPVASAALGRTLCAASLLGNAMKEENGTLTIRVAGDGPIRGVVAVSDSSGCVRGYVGEPYVGSVALISGEIAEDFTAYLIESEQIPSACGLGVLVDTDTSIKAAGGFLVQLMPGADESLITKLEDNIFMMDQLTTILDEDGTEEIFAQVLKGIEYHVVSHEPVDYRCFCSRERVAEAIACVDPAELDAMISEEKEIEVGCQFCDAKYVFTPQDLLALRREESEAAEPQNVE